MPPAKPRVPCLTPDEALAYELSVDECVALWASVIHQAIFDARAWNPRYRAEAIHWLRNGKIGVCSAQWACIAAGIDYFAMMDVVDSKLVEPTFKDWRRWKKVTKNAKENGSVEWPEESDDEGLTGDASDTRLR